MCNYMFVGI